MRAKSVCITVAALILGLTLGCSRSRNDAQIASEVQNKIDGDSGIATKQVSASASNSVVTLSGTVGSETERTAAANDAAQVEGVETVVNNLQVEAAAANLRENTAQRSPRERTRAGVPPARLNPAALVTIPEGTALSIRLIDSVDSDKNKPGDTFRATLDLPIMVGQTDEYTRQGASRGTRTAETVGGGAAVGALIGGIAGGGKGAAIGAAVGAGAGTGV